MYLSLDKKITTYHYLNSLLRILPEFTARDTITRYMMKLSTRSRYAIRALLDLKDNYKESPVSIKDIASRQNISERYLENIFHDLRKNGILSSVKGKNGGFYPGCDLNNLSLLTIVEILEGEIKIVDCSVHPEECPRSEKCDTHIIWTRLNNVFKENLKSIKLNDIEGCNPSQFVDK